MTEQEKVRAYDEAIKKLKIIHDDWVATQNRAAKEVEEIFPELKDDKEGDNEKISKEIIKYLEQTVPHNHRDEVLKSKEWIAWLEKQNNKEQLYVRFGEIPTDEKSKIYRGEVEVGTENGVSVYPAFKTDEGDIVLGLNLPITKTTLYTQQHLIEYDDRPCYLVKGDYIGKDTDGQPLINNVSIIEKIDTYRVKEKKQDEQKTWDEYDEDMRYKATAVINKLCAEGKEYVWSVNTLKQLFYWLKSLKPQSKQERSKEDKNMLEDEYRFDILDALCEDEMKNVTSFSTAYKELQETRN